MSTVSIRKTHGEDYASIKTVVDQVIADLGGLEDIIKPGYKVIIKPNLVACPTERLSGTSPNRSRITIRRRRPV